MSSFRRRQLISTVTAVGFLCAIALNLNLVNLSNVSRQLSVALENGGCFVLPAQEVGPDVKPIFAASFPGSGARMTWNLIEALTGLVTGDEWYNNGRIKNVVSVKTHFPHTHGRELDWADEIDRAFLLIRNPMNAIPSFHNFLHEYENKVIHHTVRAPIEVWIEWRDKNFDTQIQLWKEHFEYWMDRHTPDKRIVVPYEHLIDEIQGPLVTQELNTFLGQGPGVTPIDNDSVPCVWGTVIHYKKGNDTPNSRQPLPKDIKFVGNYPIWPGSHRKGPRERPYTHQQYKKMIVMMGELAQKYDTEGRRVSASLQLYMHQIKAANHHAAESEMKLIEMPNKP